MGKPLLGNSWGTLGNSWGTGHLAKSVVSDGSSIQTGVSGECRKEEKPPSVVSVQNKDTLSQFRACWWRLVTSLFIKMGYCYPSTVIESGMKALLQSESYLTFKLHRLHVIEELNCHCVFQYFRDRLPCLTMHFSLIEQKKKMDSSTFNSRFSLFVLWQYCDPCRNEQDSQETWLMEKVLYLMHLKVQFIMFLTLKKAFVCINQQDCNKVL